VNLEQNAATIDASGAMQFPVSRGWRILYGLFVVAIPSFSFWLVTALKPEWQSGRMQDYAALILQPEASLIFLILIAYSILSYLLLLINPDRLSSLFILRLGIYTGVVLTLQYSMVMFLFLFENPYSVLIFLLWLFPLYFVRLDRWATRKWGRAKARSGMLFLFLLAASIVAIINREEYYPAFLLLAGLVISGPFWSFLMAVQAAAWLVKYHETGFTLPRGLGITAWLASYAVAWRYDILKMFELYAGLPTSPPDCYIATAAAKGHPGFVNSRNVHLESGITMQVNRQLNRFKCCELALKAIDPRIHGTLRRMYDHIGRWLAPSIRNPYVSDIAYLLLKPFEWMGVVLLGCFVPEFDSITLYNQPEHTLHGD